MPIVRRSPMRKTLLGEKLPDILLFRGTLREAEETRPEDIAKALTRLDPVSQEAVDNALRLREELLPHMRELAETAGWKDRVVLGHAPNGVFALRIKKNAEGRFVIRQYPATHGLFRWDDNFVILKRILSDGFRGTMWWDNVRIAATDEDSAMNTSNRIARPGRGGPFGGEEHFSIDLLSPLESEDRILDERSPYPGSIGIRQAGTREAHPAQILSVKIGLPNRLTETEEERRKQFYRTELRQFGIPVFFTKRGPYDRPIQ
jgi:hypothetical protein